MTCEPVTPLLPGPYDLSAVQADRAGNVSTLPTEPLSTIEVAGELPKPTIEYTLGPASVAFTTEGVPTGDLSIGWYSVVPGTGEGEGGYGFDQLDTCGTGEGGGGEGGGSEFLVGNPLFAASSASCGPYENLEPGVYNAYVTQYTGGESYSSTDDYIMIPSSPTLTSTVPSGGVATFSGTGGEQGYTVVVERTAGGAICSATVGQSGAWSCTAALPAGTADYRAIQQASGFVADLTPEWIFDASIAGLSAYSASITVTVASPPPPVTPPASPPAPLATPAPTPTPTPTPTLAPTPNPAQTMFSFTISGSQLAPGDTTTVSGEGAPVLAQIDAELHSTPVHLGSTTASDSGEFSLTVTVPQDVETGEHEIVVIVTPVDGEPMTQAKAVTVLSPPRAQATVLTDALPGAVATDAATADRADPAAPSSLTSSLKTVPSVFDNPILIGGAALASLALLLLVAFPAELLNSTISENYGRITRNLPKPTLTWWGRFRAWLKVTPVLGGILITFVTAFIFGFVDPRFGFDVTSLRTVLAVGLALLIVGFLASTIAGAIIRRALGLATVIELKPLGVILAAIGVVISRLIDFSPGFLIGLVLGLSVVGVTTAAQRAKATLIQAGVVFVFAVLAWVVYSILTASGQPDSFLSALAVDTAVAVTAEGLTALFIGLLPFALLNGSSVFEHSKVLWAVSYSVAAAAFVLIVIPASWGEINGPVTHWLIVLGIFAVVAIAVYLFFRLTNKEDDGDDASTTVREDDEALEL